MIRFSLLHPSRGRLERAAQAIGEWTARRSGDHSVEHILSVDTDDDVAGYRRVADAAGVRLVVNANRSVVDAANAAARAATGEVEDGSHTGLLRPHGATAPHPEQPVDHEVGCLDDGFQVRRERLFVVAQEANAI